MTCHVPYPNSADADAKQRKSAVHRLALAFVWLAVASGAIVLSEPAPIDVLMMALIFLLPLLGLVTIPPALLVYFCLWLVVLAGAVIATSQSVELARTSTHTFITLYLATSSLILAAFVAHRPLEHTKLILNAYLCAAFVASVAGVIGYFDLLPGADALFTRFGRAAGTFKDPNVYGPFLVPALLYAIHLCFRTSLAKALLPVTMIAFLSFAILLSFSRGAWINLGLALLVFGYFSFVTATSNRLRLRLLVAGVLGSVLAVLVVAFAVQFDDVASLLSERAHLVQSYDVGPEGRYGGHEKARSLILDHPFGIGALQFGERYHHEAVHNVYLSMFLNAGWVGGLFYIVIIATTVLCGLRHCFRPVLSQPLFLIVFAALIGTIVEGAVIDTDHWRHFFLEMALVWGLMVADRTSLASRRSARALHAAPASHSDMVKPRATSAMKVVAPRRPPRTLRAAPLRREMRVLCRLARDQQTGVHVRPPRVLQSCAI